MITLTKIRHSNAKVKSSAYYFLSIYHHSISGKSFDTLFLFGKIGMNTGKDMYREVFMAEFQNDTQNSF